MLIFDFYLSLKSSGSKPFEIKNIEFCNAFVSSFGDKKRLILRELHYGVADTDFPDGVKVYRISGTFTFEPELARYPFDKQHLSISIQPARTDLPFLIQPPGDAIKSAPSFEVDGWQVHEQFVGTDQDIIPTLDAETGEKWLVPFYTFTYTWLVKRNTTDFRLRVIAPLGFILLVTYFSILLGKSRFDATIAIQVTALLSAIALYLALPKIDSDQATLLDRVFITTYAMVAMMIGLTVVKDMRAVDEWAFYVRL